MPKIERLLERIALALEDQDHKLQVIADACQDIAHKPSENDELQALRHAVHSTTKAIETLPIAKDLKDLLLDQLDVRALAHANEAQTEERRKDEFIKRLTRYLGFTGIELHKGEQRRALQELVRAGDTLTTTDEIDAEIACIVHTIVGSRRA